jgi:hypothetical protein
MRTPIFKEGGEGGNGGLGDDALGAGRVVCVADTQLPTASAGMSKSRLVQGGGYAYTAFVELSGPRRAGGVEGQCVAAGQEGRVSGVEGTSWSWSVGARLTIQAARGGG